MMFGRIVPRKTLVSICVARRAMREIHLFCFFQQNMYRRRSECSLRSLCRSWAVKCAIYEPTVAQISARVETILNDLKRRPVSVFANQTGDTDTYGLLTYKIVQSVVFASFTLRSLARTSSWLRKRYNPRPRAQVYRRRRRLDSGKLHNLHKSRSHTTTPPPPPSHHRPR